MVNNALASVFVSILAAIALYLLMAFVLLEFNPFVWATLDRAAWVLVVFWAARWIYKQSRDAE